MQNYKELEIPRTQGSTPTTIQPNKYYKNPWFVVGIVAIGLIICFSFFAPKIFATNAISKNIAGKWTIDNQYLTIVNKHNNRIEVSGPSNIKNIFTKNPNSNYVEFIGKAPIDNSTSSLADYKFNYLQPFILKWDSKNYTR